MTSNRFPIWNPFNLTLSIIKSHCLQPLKTLWIKQNSKLWMATTQTDLTVSPLRIERNNTSVGEGTRQRVWGVSGYTNMHTSYGTGKWDVDKKVLWKFLGQSIKTNSVEESMKSIQVSKFTSEMCFEEQGRMCQKQCLDVALTTYRNHRCLRGSLVLNIFEILLNFSEDLIQKPFHLTINWFRLGTLRSCVNIFSEKHPFQPS